MAVCVCVFSVTSCPVCCRRDLAVVQYRYTRTVYFCSVVRAWYACGCGFTVVSFRGAEDYR